MNKRHIRHLLLTIVFTIFSGSFLVAQEIKIMAWNIFMVPPFVFKSCQTERAFLIADYIKNEDPDIVIMEEAFMKSTRKIISDSLKQQFPYSSEITRKGFLKTNSGVWIMSKFPLKSQYFITYKKRKGSDRFAKKGAVYVEAEIQNKKLQLIATHMQSLVKYAAAREQQFKQLKEKMLDVYFCDTVPQLIIGDLNCNYYDTVEYNKMLGILETQVISFTGEKYSWNGLENDLAHKFSEHTLETLDYVLLRKQHQEKAIIKSMEILKPKRDTCYCKQNFQYISDHHPVISTIELK